MIIQYDWVFVKEEIWTRTCTEERADDDEDIYKPRNQPKAMGETWTLFFLTVFRRKQPCQHLDLRLLVSTTVRVRQ